MSATKFLLLGGNLSWEHNRQVAQSNVATSHSNHYCSERAARLYDLRIEYTAYHANKKKP